MKKLYAFLKEEKVAIVITEDGNGVIHAEADTKADAMKKTGVIGNNFHKQYDMLFPEGWDIEWVDDPDQHEGVRESVKINLLKICN